MKFGLRYPIMGVIKIYQALFSFDHGIPGKIFPNYRVCRFYPSCSAYSYEAVRRHGSIRGTFLAMKRIVKCGPWTEFGTHDPVPSHPRDEDETVNGGDVYNSK